MKYAFLLLTIIFLIFPSPAYAVVNPLITSNNKFGIHIFDESDIPLASKLVNSSGGEWGYVTIVIREDERDTARWQSVFNQMQSYKLIPLVRIATTMNNSGWEKPQINEAKNWALFLGSLKWPTQNRYVILFNEPNHAKEWGGKIEPEEYAKVSRAYWEQLKKMSEDFFVLPAGMDSAASTTKSTLKAVAFFDRMYKQDELIFTIFDGWSSHSYPNPGFSGKPTDTGAMSIAGFQFELEYLSKYHLSSTSPIFITETGWTSNKSDADKIADNYEYAFSNVWSNPNIVAITPFILRYNSNPFEKFSWLDPKTNDLSEQFRRVSEISKVAGKPVINTAQNIVSWHLPLSQ